MKELQKRIIAGFIGIIIGLFIVMPISGCKTNKTEIINRTNAIYKNIKLIVTDPEISPLLSEDAHKSLIEAERMYLEAVQALEESEGINSDSGKSALGTIVSCADTLLSVLDSVGVLDKYQPVITAARVSVKLLKSISG